jgi:hypothetical protein
LKNPNYTKEASVRIEPFVFRIESLILGPIPPQVGELAFFWHFVVYPVDHLGTDKARRNATRYATNESDDPDDELGGRDFKK